MKPTSEYRMAKTLVMAKHSGGPLLNGADGCHTRWLDGFCSGKRVAEWLNSLGDDNATYTPIKARDGHTITCGEVRMNWLAQDTHIVPIDDQEARLTRQKQDLLRQLRAVRRKLARLRKTVKGGTN